MAPARRRPWRSEWVALLSMLLVGCAASAPPLLITEQDGKTVHAITLTQWLAEHPLQDDQELSIQEIGRTDGASFHLVQVRTSERPHFHKAHDGVVVIQQGGGTLFVGTESVTLKPGSVVNIPRGVIPYFVNESPKPTVAFVVFSPPFDGKDTIPVPEQP